MHTLVRITGALLFVLATVTPLQGYQRVAAATRSDQTVLDLPARLTVRDTPLAAALKYLHASSGVDLVFSPSGMRAHHPVSCSCQLLTVREALETLLAQTNLAFREIDGQVVITRRPETSTQLAAPRSEIAEETFDLRTGSLRVPSVPVIVQSISGIVQHALTGRPIPGAEVRVVGTDILATTDNNGRFTLTNVPAGQVTLTVVRIGYRAQTLRVTSGATGVVVELRESLISLDGIVVTGTPGEQAARSLGNAISIVDVDEVIRVAPPRDMQTLLSAQVPGLRVTSAGGEVGSGGNTRIRGVSSMALSGEPLVYVDGVRVNSRDFATRALVPGGRIGTSSEGPPSRLNDFNPDEIESIEVIKGPAAATLYGTEASNGVIQIITKRGRAGRTRVDLHVSQGAIWLPDANGDAFPHVFYREGGPGSGGQIVEVNLLQEDLERGLGPWFRTGHAQSYGGAVNGGSENVQFYASLDWDRDEGVVPYNWQNKLSARGNLTFTPSAAFEARFSLGYVRNTLQSASTQSPISQGVMWGCQSPGCEPGAGQPFDLDGPTRGYFQILPEVVEDEVEGFEHVDRTTLSVQARHTPFEWLTHRLIVGGDFGTTVNTGRWLATGNFGNLNSDGLKQNQDLRNLFASFDYGATATYDKFSNFSFATSGGVQFHRKQENLVYTQGANFPVSTLETISSGATFSAVELISENRTFGMYFQEQISWNDRIFVTGALRGDDNSAFGSAFDFQMYPKLSATWVISDEPFFANNIVNGLKLRGAWGKAGQQPDVFAALQTWAPDVGPGQAPMVTPSSIGNPDLEPEVGVEFELGFDASLIGDRVGLDFTYFDQTRTNAIVNVPVAPSLGIPGIQFQNIGEVKNNGFELGLNARVLDLEDVGLDVQVTYSTAKNEVTDLGGLASLPQAQGTGLNQHSVEGFPLASLFYKRVVSADLAGGVATNVMCEGGPLIPGTNFSRGGGAPVDCATAPEVYFGQPVPQFEGSVSAMLTLFKSLQIYGLVDFIGGYERIFIEQVLNHVNFSNSRAALELTDPIFVGYRSLGAAGNGPLGISDAGFGKFRVLSATYTFPQNWAQKIGAQRLSLSVAGENIAKLWGADEVFGQRILEIERSNVSGGTAQGLMGIVSGGGWPQNSRFITTLRVAF